MYLFFDVTRTKGRYPAHELREHAWRTNYLLSHGEWNAHILRTCKKLLVNELIPNYYSHIKVDFIIILYQERATIIDWAVSSLELIVSVDCLSFTFLDRVNFLSNVEAVSSQPLEDETINTQEGEWSDFGGSSFANINSAPHLRYGSWEWGYVNFWHKVSFPNRAEGLWTSDVKKWKGCSSGWILVFKSESTEYLKIKVPLL